MVHQTYISYKNTPREPAFNHPGCRNRFFHADVANNIPANGICCYSQSSYTIKQPYGEDAGDLHRFNYIPPDPRATSDGSKCSEPIADRDPTASFRLGLHELLRLVFSSPLQQLQLQGDARPLK